MTGNAFPTRIASRVQPWLFGDGTPVNIEDVLLEVIRPAEELAAKGAGKGVS